MEIYFTIHLLCAIILVIFFIKLSRARELDLSDRIFSSGSNDGAPKIIPLIAVLIAPFSVIFLLRK